MHWPLGHYIWLKHCDGIHVFYLLKRIYIVLEVLSWILGLFQTCYENLTEEYMTDLFASLCSFFCLEREQCPLSYGWMNLLFECFFTICRMYSEEIRMRKKGHRPKTWTFATQLTVVEQISVPVIIEASNHVVPLWSLRSQIWFRRWSAMADCITSI